MTPIKFYGLEITANIINNEIVVVCNGTPEIPIKFSKPKEIGTNKYIDKKEVLICSDVIRLRVYNDYNKGSAVVAVELNV